LPSPPRPTSPALPPAAPWRGLSPGAAASGTIAAVAGLVFSRVPLRMTDLWGHLAYGRWIAQHGPPTAEPLLPIVQVGPYVDSAWLAQWLWYRLDEVTGPAGLQCLHAGLVLLTGWLLAWAGARQTRSWWGGTIASLFWFATNWFQLQVIRPQLWGCLCGALTLVWLCGRGPHRPRPAWLIPIFLLWANLHGSFVVGWLWLALATGSLWMETLRSVRLRPDSPTALAPRDVRARQLLWGVILALATVWINPYGGQLPAAVLDVAAHPNLRDLSEWQPLRPGSRQGLIFVSSLILIALAAVGRLIEGLSQRRPASRWFAPTPAWLALSGLILALATVRSARFIVWWGPIGGLWLATLLSGRSWSDRSHWWNQPRLAWWLVPALASGIALGRSPLGTWWRTRQRPPLAEMVEAQTPLAIAEFLRAHPQPGFLFCPLEWGDYLQWRVPQSPAMPILFGSHVHLLPPDLWRDYLAVVRRSADWSTVLDRLEVQTVVLDRAGRPGLMAEIDQHPGWQRVYEDGLGAIWHRRTVNSAPKAEGDH